MDTDSTRWLKFRSGSEIRGPQDALTDDFAQKLGCAFALWLAERLGREPQALALAVGRDERPSGERIAAALIRGMLAAGCDARDCGQCAAPALFMTVQSGMDGAVMVTAAPARADLNGFKFMTSQGGPQSADVAEILSRAAEAEVPERLDVGPDAATRRYYEHLRRVAAQHLEDDALKPLLGLRVVVDARSAVGAEYARFLEALGAETDGSLTAPSPVIPDPMAAETLAALAEAVAEHRADLGVSFTADGGRAAFVDEAGRAVAQNRLIALVAAMLLDERPGLTFVTDSVTSSGLSAFIAEWGGVHYRFKRGYRNVIDEAVRLNAEGIDCPIAIETSGHAAFRENGFIDDGLYLATRLICEALNRKREGQTLSALIDDLQEPVESAEIRLPVVPYEDWDPEEEVQAIVEGILSHTLTHPEWQMAPDNREGVRITFNLDGGVNNAWFQLRMSVHDPVMVLNAESAVPGGVKRILRALHELIQDTEYVDLQPLKAALG